MTCDGELHQDELDSIRTLSEKSRIFADLDLNTELKRLSDELQQSTRASFRKFFSEVKVASLELSEQMQVMEVVIRVIYADGRIDENEVMYLKKIISILGTPLELLEQRFGSIRNLMGLSEQQTYNTSSEVKEFEAPQIEDFEHIAFKELKSDDSDSK